jgi:opacity protein-like surface antigen
MKRGGFMTRFRGVLLAVSMVVGFAVPARADLTGFIGANVSPETRMTRGFSVGAGLLLLGAEFEYAATSEDLESQSPSLKTYMGNVLLQTPFAILGMQPYVTTGAGVYRERLEPASKTGFGLNSGAGVKVNLLGPLRVRVDYRAFRLGSDALYSPAHRFYAGLNLKF